MKYYEGYCWSNKFGSVFGALEVHKKITKNKNFKRHSGTEFS